MVRLESERKVTATIKITAQGLSAKKEHVDKIIEVYKYIFTSPTRMHVYYQVKHSIDLTHDPPLPNDLVYRHSLIEN